MSLRLIRCCWEFQPQKNIRDIGEKRRGIYVLYEERGRLKNGKSRYDVLYIGMTDANLAQRLRGHRRKKKWTHFSVYEVWPNITEDEIRELEGLFRYIYRRDGRANIFNKQKGSGALWKIRAQNAGQWKMSKYTPVKIR